MARRLSSGAAGDRGRVDSPDLSGFAHREGIRFSAWLRARSTTTLRREFPVVLNSDTNHSVSRAMTSHHRPEGHVLLPAAAIGALSILLAAGLELLGLVDRMNAGIAGLVSRNGAEKFPKHLPFWCIWLAAVVFAFGLALAILGTPGFGRRGVLWISALFVITGWAPVLSLAAHAPEIAAPWIATMWSGVCALVYACSHRMAGDQSPPTSDVQG
jgi:hypothetical protein